MSKKKLSSIRPSRLGALGASLCASLRVRLFACMALVALAGCAFKTPREPALQLSVIAEPTLNPEGSGAASPVVLRVYQLRARDAFDRAMFFELYEHESAVLGSAMLSQTVLTVRPGERLNIERPLDPATSAVAVIAAYRRIDEATWRAVVDLKESRSRVLIAKLGASTLSLTADPEAEKKARRGFFASMVARITDPIRQVLTSARRGAVATDDSTNSRPGPTSISPSISPSR
jgi:type VI secretion system protein VasD